MNGKDERKHGMGSLETVERPDAEKEMQIDYDVDLIEYTKR